MKILTAILLLVSGTVSANQVRMVEGNYVRYEGTEYESIFLPCQSTEVWSLDGGNAFDALVDYYSNSRTSTASEIRTSLMLDVLPVDRTENPGSHIDAVAKVIAIVSLSEDENEVVSCRDD